MVNNFQAPPHPLKRTIQWHIHASVRVKCPRWNLRVNSHSSIEWWNNWICCNSRLASRSLALDEHIKLVKQKKEEAEILRLQRFQEQLRKKEQKWFVSSRFFSISTRPTASFRQQQQLERMKKWLQLRNRDHDHRNQVEERRRKREEEAKVDWFSMNCECFISISIDFSLGEDRWNDSSRERTRTTSDNHTTVKVTLVIRMREMWSSLSLLLLSRTQTPSQRPESVMSMSTDVLSTRRAVSASRLRTNPNFAHENRRAANPSSSNSVGSSDGKYQLILTSIIDQCVCVSHGTEQFIDIKSHWWTRTEFFFCSSSSHFVPTIRQHWTDWDSEILLGCCLLAGRTWCWSSICTIECQFYAFDLRGELSRSSQSTYRTMSSGQQRYSHWF